MWLYSTGSDRHTDNIAFLLSAWKSAECLRVQLARRGIGNKLGHTLGQKLYLHLIPLTGRSPAGYYALHFNTAVIHCTQTQM